MPDPMTPDLDAIRERLEAVPAHVFDFVAIDSGRRLVSVLVGEDLGNIAASREADAVVALLTDLHSTFDALLTEIELLRAENTKLRGQVSLAADDPETLNVAYEVGYANGRRDTQGRNK